MNLFTAYMQAQHQASSPTAYVGASLRTHAAPTCLCAQLVGPQHQNQPVAFGALVEVVGNRQQQPWVGSKVCEAVFSIPAVYGAIAEGWQCSVSGTVAGVLVWREA